MTDSNIQALNDCKTRIEIQKRENTGYINGLGDALEAFENFIPDVLLLSFEKIILSRLGMNAGFSEQIAEIQILIRNQEERVFKERQQEVTRDLN